jgi:glycosyltransferase involved in cell wall biosynthesis
MRILHLIPYMHPSTGGPPVVVDHWCVELQARGHSVQVITTDAYSDGANDWVDAYAKRFPIQVASRRGPNGFGYSPQLRAMVRQALPETDLVHIHNVWSYLNQVGMSECRRQGVPYVVSTHGMLDPHSMGRKPWKKQLYGWLLEWTSLRHASAIVFTHQEEDRLSRMTCQGLPKGFVIGLGTEEPPNGSRKALAELCLTRFPQLAGRRVVLFLSRLHPKKGLDLLLPAFADVLQSIPDSLLLLVGPGDASYVDSLRDMATQMQLGSSVVFAGPLHNDEKWGALSAAEVFVLPSYQENFAIAVAEAMRAGTVVVCSERVNICNDIVDAFAAVKCELDSADIAVQIKRILLDGQLRKSLGQNATNYAARHYTWSVSAAKLIDAYQQILAQ